jgi:hypothetical protein
MAGDLPFEESLVVEEEGRTAFDVAAALGAATPAAEPPGRVLHYYGDRVRVLAPSLAEEAGAEALAARNLAADVSADVLAGLTETEQLGIAALQARLSEEYREAKAHRPRQGEEWDMAGGCADYDLSAAPEGPVHRSRRAPPPARTSRGASPSA